MVKTDRPRNGEGRPAQPRFKTSGQIGSDAFHGVRANCFHARLFRRLENRRGIGRLWPIVLMQRVFMIGQAQCESVSLSAYNSDF